MKGLKGLEKSLLALAKTYGSPKYALQALRPAIRKALMPIFELIKRTTPVDTGRLRDSTKLAIRRPKANEKKNPGIGKNAVLIGLVGWFWRSGSPIGRQGLAVEFGTQHRPAKPVLRPALERNFSKIVTTFRTELGTAIKKKARQLHKKNRR